MIRSTRSISSSNDSVPLDATRELSDKVFRGCVKIAQQGYWAGGKPRYGFRRLLFNEARQPVQILQPGERKGIQNQRVTLALGDEREVAVVRRIFHEFTDGGRHEQAIADGLNRDGIPSPGGSTWDGTKVRDILIDERYTGTMVYNRTSQKLKTPSRRKSQGKWIRTPESFERIIEPAVFARARQIFAERARVYTPAYMLEKLETFFRRMASYGRPWFECPGHAIPIDLREAFWVDGLGISTTFQPGSYRGRQPGHRAHRGIGQAGGRLRGLLGHRPETHRPRSTFRADALRACQLLVLSADRREVIDITLGVPLSEDKQPRILGYLALPRLLVQDHWIRLFSTSQSRLEMYAHNGLAIIEQLLS